MAILTAAEVISHSRITYEDVGFADSATYTTYLTGTLIASVQAILEKIIGGPQTPSGLLNAGGVTVTNELYDMRGDGKLFLRYRPVVSLTTLQYNNAENDAAASWTTLTEGPGLNTNFLLYKESGLIEFYSTIPATGSQRVRVTYKPGWAAIPADIKLIALEVCARVCQGLVKKELGPQEVAGLVMTGTGDLRALFAEELKLNSTEVQLLKPYQIVRAKRG